MTTPRPRTTATGSAARGTFRTARALTTTGLVAAAAVLLLGLSACGDDSGSTDLANRTFESTGAQGRELVEGSTVRLSFQDDRMSINAGCNTLMGGASWDDGTISPTAELAMSLMACDDALEQQDRWLAELFNSSPAYTYSDGTLVVGTDDDGLTFEEVTED